MRCTTAGGRRQPTRPLSPGLPLAWSSSSAVLFPPLRTGLSASGVPKWPSESELRTDETAGELEPSHPYTLLTPGIVFAEERQKHQEFWIIIWQMFFSFCATQYDSVQLRRFELKTTFVNLGRFVNWKPSLSVSLNAPSCPIRPLYSLIDTARTRLLVVLPARPHGRATIPLPLVSLGRCTGTCVDCYLGVVNGQRDGGLRRSCSRVRPSPVWSPESIWSWHGPQSPLPHQCRSCPR